ncbi:DUF2512 family protein [Ornithinibacillus sp. FSL M8-0202]|uniref:DUF2512 family protein n=1 Tax=unclassified Ornithinibacillus TaxID=2620869 RepID=UPI0030D29A54
MNYYLKPFIIKLVLTTAILWIVLGLIYHVSLMNILIISIIISTLAFLGDIFILPSVRNFWATIGDFGLSFVGIYVLGLWLTEDSTFLTDAALISAIGIAIGEVFYHRYLKDNIFHAKNRSSPQNIRTFTGMQTEFSKELDDPDDNHQ